MVNSESSEMYLETIYLLEEKHGHAHPSEIAKHLGVSKPSVTKAMKALVKKDLIVKEAYGPITLTAKGKAVSKKIYENHTLITAFLIKSLGLDEVEAADNACRIEHVISDTMRKAIIDYLG